MRGTQRDLHRGDGEQYVERCSAPEEVRTPCANADPDLWFAERPAELSLAKALCAHCPIKAACLAGALARSEPWGVWGGEIVHQGVVLAYKRGRGRPSNADRRLGLVTRIAGAEGAPAAAPGARLPGSRRARRPVAVVAGGGGRGEGEASGAASATITRPDTAGTFHSRSA
jgi:Transcription factor WhiB